MLNFFSLALAAIDHNVRESVKLAFIILIAIASVAGIVIVMMQKGTNDNVGVITGASDTFYGKNKEKNKEGILKKITFALFAFVLVAALICFIVASVD